MSYLRGLPSVYGVDAMDVSTVQQHQLGTVGYDALFRRYRYVQAGAVALVKGNLLQSPARSTDFTDMAVQAAAALDARSIEVTLGSTATTADMFTEGTMVISVTPGIGQNFTIAGHDVTAAAGTCTFNINESILTALTTSSKTTVTKNPYDGVVVSPTTRTGVTVGVAMSAVAISGYGWIGVEGQFGVLSDATVAAVGESLSPSTSTAGCVTKQVTLLETIGTAGILGVSAEVQPCFLKLP